MGRGARMRYVRTVARPPSRPASGRAVAGPPPCMDVEGR